MRKSVAYQDDSPDFFATYNGDIFKVKLALSAYFPTFFGETHIVGHLATAGMSNEIDLDILLTPVSILRFDRVNFFIQNLAI